MRELTFFLRSNNGTCGSDCPEFLDYWEHFWTKQTKPGTDPIAVLDCRDYLVNLHKNARKSAHRAMRRYEFRQFELNEYRKQVQSVNASKLETSQGPTHGWFRRAIPDEKPKKLCRVHQELWYGGFDKGDVLRGYWSIAKLNNLGTSIWLFKHAENSDYVLNGLIAHIAETAKVDFVTYHTMKAEQHTGRPEFKRRIGCEEAHLSFV